jgi:hypothetical protein
VQWEVLELRNILLRYYIFVTLPSRVPLLGAAKGNFVFVANRNIITTWYSITRIKYYIQITNKKNCNVYDIRYSLYSHHHVSAAIEAIFRVVLLLQLHKCTNVFI